MTNPKCYDPDHYWILNTCIDCGKGVPSFNEVAVRFNEELKKGEENK